MCTGGRREASGSPNPVKQVGGSSHLLKNVAVTVQTTGSCSGLKLHYSPFPLKDVPLNQSGSTWTGLLPKTDNWSTGKHKILVLDATNTLLGNFDLTVCPSSGC